MNNKYVVNGWERLVPTGEDPGWLLGGFHLIYMGGNKYAIYGNVDGNNSRYTCADYFADHTNWRLRSNREAVGYDGNGISWEKFEIIKLR